MMTPSNDKLKNSKSIAIVTGASSGLGQEYVKYLCEKFPLDEIWLVARRGGPAPPAGGSPVRPVKSFPSGPDGFKIHRSALPGTGGGAAIYPIFNQCCRLWKNGFLQRYSPPAAGPHGTCKLQGYDGYYPDLHSIHKKRKPDTGNLLRSFLSAPSRF